MNKSISNQQRSLLLTNNNEEHKHWSQILSSPVSTVKLKMRKFTATVNSVTRFNHSWKLIVINLLTKVSQISVDFLGYFQNATLSPKAIVATVWATVVKNWAFLTLSSGLTADSNDTTTSTTNVWDIIKQIKREIVKRLKGFCFVRWILKRFPFFLPERLEGTKI